MRNNLLVLILVLSALSSIASASIIVIPGLYSGGGRPATDCFLQYTGVQGRMTSCLEGSECDADSLPDDMCTFDIGLCVNLPSDRCQPPHPLDSCQISDNGLQYTCQQLLGLSDQTCFNSFVRVPAGSSKRIASQAVSGNLVDRDAIVLECAPAIFTCCTSDEVCFKSTINDCRSAGGAVMECVPPKIGERTPPGANVTLTPANTSSEFARNVTRDANSTGVHTQPYVNKTHDCDDFADELERNLTALGYNATFTVYWCYNNAGQTTTAHCVTDVHAPDGRVIFIEPQTAQITNLDFDGDGMVEVRTHHENNRVDTDDRCEIEMYDNHAAAVAAGVVMD